VFFTSIFYWINKISGYKLFDFTISVFYLSLFFGIFGLAFNFTAKRKRMPLVLAAPALWVSLEYLRSHAGALSFPLALIGHSQYLNLPVIQISSFTGAYGVSFLIVMVNTVLSDIVLRYLSRRESPDTGLFRLLPLKSVIVTIFILAILLVYGFSVLSNKPGGERVGITVIQGNIPHSMRWKPEFRKLNLQKHIKLTKEALKNVHNTLLIAWPEIAAEGSLPRNISILSKLFTLARETRTHLLIGSSDRPKFGDKDLKKKKRFNSAFLISPKSRILGQYNKIYLTPFGEYLPYKDSFPWPSRYRSASASFSRGSEHTIFQFSSMRFGTTICWENVFPDFFRQFVKDGAEFMVNITNEAWFGESPAPYHFVSMNVFRSVENRVSIARSAYSGISCFIDPYGRIIGKISKDNKDILVEGFMTEEIPLSQQKTFYTQYGNIFTYVNMLFSLFIPVLSFTKKQKE
jgi:apolipoprotein N-acyltransferase